jgi:hypothetical protein
MHFLAESTNAWMETNQHEPAHRAGTLLLLALVPMSMLVLMPC